MYSLSVCVRPSPLVHYLMYLTFVVVALPASIFGGANKPQSTSTCTSVCVYQCVYELKGVYMSVYCVSWQRVSALRLL